MEMSKNYKEIGKEILKNIGGKENVISAAHCATRLRLVLKDDKNVNVKEIESMAEVKGSFNTSGQFQRLPCADQPDHTRQRPHGGQRLCHLREV